MGIERDLIRPAISERGGRWAVFSAGGPGYTLALRTALGPSAEIRVFERDRSAIKQLTKSLASASGTPSNVTIQQASVTQQQDLHDLDGVVAAHVLHAIPLDQQQRTLALLVSYLREGGSLIFIETEQARGSLRIRNPLDYDGFEYFAGLIGLRDVRRVALAPTGWWRTAYAALAFRA